MRDFHFVRTASFALAIGVVVPSAAQNTPTDRVASATPTPAQSATVPPVRIVIASDSTAADYPADRYPQMGWGMVLRCSLKPGVEVVNLARGGRSTKTFREEGLWSSLLVGLKPADTVLIQFGHNDEDLTKPQRHTEADGDFTANLRRMVTDVRERQAQPVLLTPIARVDYEDGRLQETHGAYAAAIKRVAAETRTPLIDLNARSMAALDRLGQVTAESYFLMTPLPNGKRDTTHPREKGARMAAAIVARELKGLRLPVSRRMRPLDPAKLAVRGNAACG